jgi:oligosaccharide repeat unit polymerase
MNTKSTLKSLITIFVYFIFPVGILLNGDVYLLPAWLTLFFITYLIGKLILVRKNHFLYASVLVFFYVFLLIAPIFQTALGEFPWGGYYANYDIEVSWWLTFVALMCFELGYVLVNKSVLPRQSNIQNNLLLSKQGLCVLFLVAIVTTFVGVSYLGFSNLFVSRTELSVVTGALSGSLGIQSLIISLTRIPTVMILLIFTYDLFVKKEKSSYQYNFFLQYVMIFFLVLIVIIVNNPISTARFWVGAIFLTFFLLFIVVKTKKTATYWLGANVLILLLIFPSMDMFRKSLDVDIFESLSNISPESMLTYSGDFDAFQQQLNTVVVAEKEGIKYGNQTLTSLLFFIPRSIWGGKAEPTGVLVAEASGYRFTNLSAPITSEFYLDGKILGVIIGMVFLGLFYGKLHYYFSNNNVIILLFYCFFCSYQTYLLRGSLITTINFVMAAALFFYAVYVFRHLIFEPLGRY